MTYSDVLSLIGGLCLFLFGMQIMGAYLEKRAGSSLRSFIGKLTTNRIAGFLTGLGVTAVIQSSSATTVMVVGFVTSGVMTLRQAINVIMGANVGTTVTSWLLSMTGISSSNPFIAMLKPANFTPILALIGIVLYIGCKSDKKKDIGAIMLGFATLMFGMEAMSESVSGLRNVPEFQNILLMFSNPILGVLAGTVLTAVIQSSSASVGILQALSSTGAVTIGTAIPIIMGQNIGTCVTAMLSSIGANKNAHRAAVVHLSFNIIGTAIFLTLYCTANAIFDLAFAGAAASALSIAIIHTVFNVGCTIFMLPLAGFLEKLAIRLVPDGKTPEVESELDERLLATPAFAIARCHSMSVNMAQRAMESVQLSLDTLEALTPEKAKTIRALEHETDHYEDVLGSYLVKLSARPMSNADSQEATTILHMIGDFERLSDHAVNILYSAEEIRQKDFAFSQAAKAELRVMMDAVREIVRRAVTAYQQNDMALASTVEPMEKVIDTLKEQIRTRHILRLQSGDCSLEMGFVLSDLLTNLERVADHCSNIAGCILEMQHADLDLHECLADVRHGSEDFRQEYLAMQRKYALP